MLYTRFCCNYLQVWASISQTDHQYILRYTHRRLHDSKHGTMRRLRMILDRGLHIFVEHMQEKLDTRR